MLVPYKEKTPTKRFATRLVKPKKNDQIPKSLKVILKKHAGRSGGKVTVRHQAGRQKRYYRIVDFKRDKWGIEGVVEAFEYDPNRNVNLALIAYPDGEKRFILAPQGLQIGDKVIANEKAEIKPGNAMKLQNIPIGTMVHNVELVPGKGGQLARSAGTAVTLIAKEGGYAHLKLPSGEIRMVPLECFATIGVLGNEDWKNIVLGKAGRKRLMGIKPTVRGTAQDPRSHPHGGGEGRSGVGRKKPMTKYGKPAVGKTRPANKPSDKFIIQRRK